MTVILLAAGLSTRMGTNKLLLPFRGKTIIETTLETVLSFTKRVVVVTGHESERIREAIRDYSITTVYAEEYLRGQRWSTVKGIETVENDDFAIVPADLPLLSIQDLKGTAEMLNSYTIARAYHDSIPGHPVMYRKEHKESLLSFGGTMKEYLSLFETGKYEGSAGCIFDADTEESYKALLKTPSEPD